MCKNEKKNTVTVDRALDIVHIVAKLVSIGTGLVLLSHELHSDEKGGEK